MQDDIKLFKDIEEFISYATPLKRERFLLLIGEDFNFNQDKLVENEIDFYGAIYPYVILDENRYTDQMISIKLPTGLDLELIEDIGNIEDKRDSFKNVKSLLILVDGLSKSITNFLENIFNYTDINVNIIGGGAGKSNLIHQDVIFHDKKAYKDSAIVIKFKEKIHYAVNHGWKHIKGPFIVTASSENILHEIDYENALSFYKKVIEEDLKEELSEERFLKLLNHYSIGIIRNKDDFVLRDSIPYNDEIKLIGSISQNSIINILKCDQESLLESSQKSANAIKNYLDDSSIVFLFDCVSRSVFLKDDYHKELKLIKKNLNSPIIGLGTVGEIASDNTKYIDVLNKCCVVGACRCF